MKVHLLSGFLGSGKTTAIQKAASILISNGKSVGVITNDQGVKLVDGSFFSSLNLPSRQVINGCFCCNYNELDNNIGSLIETANTDIIFAESVGSCTDIVATVMKPLLRYRSGTEVTVSTFADARLLYMILSGNSSSFDESVTYIYNKQLEEAGIIVITKIDLMAVSELEDLTGMMKDIYGHKTLIFQNSFDTDSLQQWLDVLDDSLTNNKLDSLEIDYDVYGAGEGMLAWLDQEIEIFSASDTALEDAYNLMNLIYEKILAKGYPIGHLKFLINDKIKESFTSTSKSWLTTSVKNQSPYASVLVNARVQTTPEILSGLVSECLKNINHRSGSTIAVKNRSAFQPGYPRPTHRIV